jgi:phosphoglycerate dehydrogenase-like enzyme
VIVCVPDSDAVTLLGQLPEGVQVITWDGRADPPPNADQVDFLVAPYGVPATPADLVAGLPNLRTVQLLSAGVDAWLDALPEGVVLCRGVGVHTNSTADLALALLLSSVRQLPMYARQQAARQWESHGSGELADQRVLIIGAGDIGQAIARRLRACEAAVTLVARTGRDDVHGIDELPRLLPVHDVVILIVPLTDATRHLVDAAFLAAMPDGALLVNVARGPVVDTDALVAELRSGRLRAGLDVADPEPLPADHPLWDAPNVIITPHIGGGTVGWGERAYRLASEQIRRVAAGEQPRYIVTGRY